MVSFVTIGMGIVRPLTELLYIEFAESYVYILDNVWSDPVDRFTHGMYEIVHGQETERWRTARQNEEFTSLQVR